MPDLFQLLVDPAKTNSAFNAVATERRYQSARRLLQDVFDRMPVRDGGFVKDFQSTEFDTRQFELFVSEVLHEAGAMFTIHGDQPDFEATVRGIDFCVECVTVNPTKPDAGLPEPYKAANLRDADLTDLQDRLVNDVPTRFGGALHSKCKRRFKPHDLPYWDLPHVAGKPFVFAVQTFHEDGVLAFSGSAIASYLYGIQHLPARDAEGNLIIRQVRVPPHRKANGTLIPSAFFDYEEMENLAGVLWSNTGTIPKFQRMAMQKVYPDAEVRGFRVGNAADPDPNAHAPATFIYEVGDPEWMETWGEGCILFHSPRALHPLPRDLLTNVVNGHMDSEGRYIESIPPGMHPFMSLSFFGVGEAEQRGAAFLAEQLYNTIEAVNENNRNGGAGAWWDGFDSSEEINSYRSNILNPKKD